jgi:hypothetical protein
MIRGPSVQHPPVGIFAAFIAERNKDLLFDDVDTPFPGGHAGSVALLPHSCCAIEQDTGQGTRADRIFSQPRSVLTPNTLCATIAPIVD